jgi:hypothetical protein
MWDQTVNSLIECPVSYPEITSYLSQAVRYIILYTGVYNVSVYIRVTILKRITMFPRLKKLCNVI